MIILLKPGLRISEQGTLFDPETGDSFTMNETGLVILRYLQEGITPDQVYDRLSQEFILNVEGFKRMLIDFKALLNSFQLLQHE